MAGSHRVGRVGDDGREAAAELVAQFRQAATVAGNPYDRAPAWASATAMPRPNPRLAPVTTAVVPASSCDVMSHSLLLVIAFTRTDPGGRGN